MASSARVQIRRPYQTPIDLLDRYESLPEKSLIQFLHPNQHGVAPSTLLHLPAFDQVPEPSSGTAWGIEHETARIACGILAGNRWDGFFTSAESGDRVADSVHLLTEARYIFHVPGEHGVGGYPIVRDFSSWRFPHGKLPRRWRFAIPPDQRDSHSRNRSQHSRKSLDDTCRMTRTSHAIHHAHLIPVAHENWFHMNAMTTYLPTTSADLSNAANYLPLRSDIHTIMDSGRFCIVPKPAPPPNAPAATALATDPTTNRSQIDTPCYRESPGLEGVHLVAHIIRLDASYEFFEQYHNVSVQKLQGIRPEFLFAAFAEKVIDACRFFIQDGVSRPALKVVAGEGGVGAYEVQPVALTHEAKGGRASSSKKRKDIDADESQPNDAAKDICVGDSSSSDVGEQERPKKGKPSTKRKRIEAESEDEDEFVGQDNNQFGGRGRPLKRVPRHQRCVLPLPRTPSTVTSAGARTPSAADPDSPPSKRRRRSSVSSYSYHVEVNHPTKQDLWENEDAWFDRERRLRGHGTSPGS